MFYWVQVMGKCMSRAPGCSHVRWVEVAHFFSASWLPLKHSSAHLHHLQTTHLTEKSPLTWQLRRPQDPRAGARPCSHHTALAEAFHTSDGLRLTEGGSSLLGGAALQYNSSSGAHTQLRTQRCWPPPFVPSSFPFSNSRAHSSIKSLK